MPPDKSQARALQGDTMKIIRLLALSALILPLFTLACTKEKQNETPARTELSSPDKKLGYAFGLDIGASLKRLKAKIDLGAVQEGIRDQYNGTAPLLSPAAAQKIKQDFSKKWQAERQARAKKLADKNKKEGEAFLAANKGRKGVQTTASGLQYIKLRKGTGRRPTASDTVKVNYSGKLIDGTVFDSTLKRGQPATFPVRGLIPGWKEALQLMRVGGKYRLFVPSNLAYGRSGFEPTIGPNATLIFDMELLSIEK